MKTLSFFFIALIAVSGAVNGQTKAPLKLSGSVAGINTGVVYLQKFENKMFFTIDSARIRQGKFVFSTPVVLPELYGLSLNTGENPFYLFAENKPIDVQLDSASHYRNTKVRGSASQDIFAAYKENQRDVDITAFIRQNPASIVAAYVLYRDFSYRLTPQQIGENVRLLAPSLYQTQYVVVLNELVKTLATVEPGKKAPDFVASDPGGKTVRLSDHFGKYLLIDFWAGWCGPCRRENPNVVKAYLQYKDRGFDVIGVSLDKTKESWLKAIDDDHLSWTQVSDLAYWNSAPAKLYGVRAIPANFLIDPSGVIIARNLRGRALEAKLEEILGNKAVGQP